MGYFCSFGTHLEDVLRLKIANVFSEVFSPFILTGLLTTVIAVQTDRTPLSSVIIPLVFIALIPQGISIYLHRSSRTTDRFIAVRKQRTPFYIATLASVLIGAVCVNFIDTSHEVKSILNLALGTVVAVTVVNLRIKVSIHALICAVFAVLIPFYSPMPWLFFILCLFIGAATVWSRRALNRHSTPELVLGTVFGVLIAVLYLIIR